jgi:type I restriction enzyme S subunit
MIEDSDWTKCFVADIAAHTKNALVGGPFGSNLVSKDYVPFGTPVIRGQNMGHGRWVSGDFAYVSNAKTEELFPNTARPNDLVFTQRGTLGQVAIIPPQPFGLYIISQSQMKLTVDTNKADNLFLYYFFISEEQQNYIKRNAIQTGVPHTNLEHLRTTPLLLPSLSEQQAIAHILGSLDDKIELNRQMNKTLEAIAQATFKSWFIDFDPVRTKMEGREPYGMDVETAALFPDGFEDSELGEIPGGFCTTQIGELISLHRERLDPAKYPDKVFDCFSIPAFDEVQLPRRETGGQIKSNKYFVPFNAILLSKLNPRIPRVWLPKVSSKQMSICSTEFIVALPKTGYSREYIYSIFKSPVFLSVFATLVTGTTGSHQRVQPEHLLKLPIVLPNNNLIARFTKIVMPLYELIAQNLEEASTLISIRDTLLPKLISGQIRVKEAEKVVEAWL